MPLILTKSIFQYTAEREIYDRLLEKGCHYDPYRHSREKLDELFLADYLKIAEEHLHCPESF